MGEAIGRETLDHVAVSGCAVPGCKNHGHEFFVHARCHPHAAAKVRYVAGSGVLELRCAVCSAPIFSAAVAHEEPAPLDEPTVQHPDGKLLPGDVGRDVIGVSRKDGRVVMSFLEPKAWVGLLPAQAVALSDSLIHHAKQARKEMGGTTLGTR